MRKLIQEVLWVKKALYGTITGISLVKPQLLLPKCPDNQQRYGVFDSYNNIKLRTF